MVASGTDMIALEVDLRQVARTFGYRSCSATVNATPAKHENCVGWAGEF
jgi:hypothetical protein